MLHDSPTDSLFSTMLAMDSHFVRRLLLIVVFSIVASPLIPAAAQSTSFQYLRLGNRDDAQTRPSGGTAMMGGGTDLDEAFRWLCEKGRGGAFLVLRATRDDAYNAPLNKLFPL